MPVCPKCASQDSVQKVSAIVAGGTYQSTLDVPFPRTATSQSALAQQLSIDRSDKTWRRWALGFAQTRDKEFRAQHPRPPRGCLTTGFLIVGMALGIPACWASALLLVSGDGGSKWLTVAVVALIALLGLGLAFAADRGLAAPREYREWVKARTGARLEASEEARHIKSRTFDRWDRLFYCHRCDLVFIPDEGISAAAGEMLHMLMWG